MSVFKTWEAACPKCEHDDQIDVEAKVFVRLTADGTDADESCDGSHTFDDDSDAQCGACGFAGKYKDFKA